jgi:hypothetical protein
MFTSILIVIFSLALFGYWFRYCCILLLRNSEEQLGASRGPIDSRFGVASVIESLRRTPEELGGREELDPLHRALHHDYQVFTYLVQHAAGLELGSLEDRLLILDYNLMQLWYRVTKTVAPQQARQALTQMASILGVLVRKMGEQAGLTVEA